MLEYKSPVLLKLRIEHQPRSRLAHELREQPPSLRERLEPQVLPVKLEDIKRAEMHVATTAAQVLKFGKTSFGAGDGLPVDQACGGLERGQRFEDEREAFGPVVPVAGEQPHAIGPTARQEPEAIMLDFVNPIAAAGWMLDRTRQARLAEIGKGTQTQVPGRR